jgi:hypothetical protein
VRIGPLFWGWLRWGWKRGGSIVFVRGFRTLYLMCGTSTDSASVCSRGARSEPDRAGWKKAHALFIEAFREPKNPADQKKLARILKKPVNPLLEKQLFDYERGFLRGLGKMSLSTCFLSEPKFSCTTRNRSRSPRWPLHTALAPQPLLYAKRLRPTSRAAHRACTHHAPCQTCHQTRRGAPRDICESRVGGARPQARVGSVGIWGVCM